MFGVDIRSQTKLRVQLGKPKILIWPPCGHFESDVADNHQVSAYGHNQYIHQMWGPNFKANGQTDGQGESSILPSNFDGLTHYNDDDNN